MFKKLLGGILLVLLLIAAYIGYQWYFANDNFTRQINLVPSDAVYVLQTKEPVKNWKKFSDSKLWQHFKQHPKFAEIARSADVIDKFLEDNKGLLGSLGSRDFTLSAHVTKFNDYDFLFIIDLSNASKVSLLKNNLESVFAKLGYTVTVRNYKAETIYELRDSKSREILYLSLVANQAVCSYYGLLVEQAIDEKEKTSIAKQNKFIEVEQKTSESGLARLFINYSHSSEFLRCYLTNLNGVAADIGSTLEYSGLSLQLDDDNIDISGFTNLKDSTDGYLKALLQSGTGKVGAYEILPARTASYTSLGCDNFQVFYDNLVKVFRNNTTEYNEFEAKVVKIEKLLKINLKTNFYSWMGDEVVLSQNQSSGLTTRPEYILSIHCNDIDEAIKNLNFVEGQIKKRTPAKFQKTMYLNHEIHYLEVKDLFSLMLGKYFSKIEKPYYTIIGEYVCFSNTPETIVSLIDDYENKKTIGNDEAFKTFIHQCPSKSSLFFYVNGSRYFNSLSQELKGEPKKSAIENQKYIVCFRHSAFVMIADGNVFDTKLLSHFEIPTESDLATDEGPSQSMLDRDSLSDMERYYVEQFLSGTIVEDYENGKPKVRAETTQGVKDGKYREYYEDGSLKVKGKYNHGKKEGNWRYYDENGKRISADKLPE